jgi:hypothetical protein
VEALPDRRPLILLLAETADWHPAVKLLLEGRACALAAGKDPRAYAVGAEPLRKAGLTEEGFRVLLDGAVSAARRVPSPRAEELAEPAALQLPKAVRWS